MQIAFACAGCAFDWFLMFITSVILECLSLSRVWSRPMLSFIAPITTTTTSSDPLRVW